MREVWVVVEDFPNYEVSNYGEVVSSNTGRRLPLRRNSVGRPRVTMYCDGHRHDLTLAHVVARAFLPEYREGVRVKNINGDYEDNRVPNLYIPVEGEAPPVRYRRQDTWGPRVTIVETGQVFKSVRDLARYLGGDYSAIYRVLRGERAHHMGYTFEFYDEEEE